MVRSEVAVRAEKAVALRQAPGGPAEIPVYVARPDGPVAGDGAPAPGGEAGRPGLIVIQEIFGVNPHIQDVCRRFAAAGFVVAAPDLFCRNGHWQAYIYDQVAEGRAQAGALSESMVMGDVQAAHAFLAAQPDVDPARIGIVGYCLGGRGSFIAASLLGEQIRAAAIYYGGGIAAGEPNERWPAVPVARAGQIRCPVIAFFGEKDRHIPVTDVRRIDEALAEAGVEHEVYCYAGADHGFFCDARASFHPAVSQDAWHRTRRFFHRHLGPVPEVAWREA